MMISLSNNNDMFSRPEISELGWAVTDGGKIAEVRHADRRDHAVGVDDVDAMLGRIGGERRGAKIAQSQTRRDQRGGQKCLSLSLSRQKWMEHAKVCVLQNAKTFANEKTFRNGIEQERPAPSRRWEVNI